MISMPLRFMRLNARVLCLRLRDAPPQNRSVLQPSAEGLPEQARCQRNWLSECGDFVV